MRFSQWFAMAVGRCVRQQWLAKRVPHTLRLVAVLEAIVLTGNVQQIFGVVGTFDRYNGHTVANALRSNDWPIE